MNLSKGNTKGVFPYFIMKLDILSSDVKRPAKSARPGLGQFRPVRPGLTEARPL